MPYPQGAIIWRFKANCKDLKFAGQGTLLASVQPLFRNSRIKVCLDGRKLND
jgi:hypothetical protein